MEELPLGKLAQLGILKWMNTQPVAFIPGTAREPLLPLARFLPPLSPGSVTGWLRERAAPGCWVIDPLNASPALALEAARAGHRVVVVSNNPVLTFMLEVLASAPQPAEFQTAIAELGAARRGEERLELHMQALYQTTCGNCGEAVQAQAFLWRRSETVPYARIYHSPHCREEGERPLEPADLERLNLPGNASLHRARALSRVAGPQDDHYAAAEEAVAAYLDRPLYALSTLINKQEGLALQPAQRRLLVAMLISACDSASSLWPSPGGRARPRQLGVPAQFRENNVWLALEESIPTWCAQPDAVPLVHWPELPPPGGISLFAGRARGLLPLPEEVKPGVVLAAFPRPNQAFWALSTMWAGWLWGREASIPLHPMLGRRRFDWNWHANAMHTPLSALSRALEPGTPLVGLLSEVVPGFLSAVLAAADGSGFHLEGLAVREDEEQAQGLWTLSAGGAGVKEGRQEELFEGGLRDVLEARAEPARYVSLHAAGLAGLARAGALGGASGANPGDTLTRLQGLVGRAFSNRRLVRRFDGGSQEDERSLWWLADPPADLEEPLADRVEREVVRLLQRTPGIDRLGLEAAVCASFPENLTPPADLVEAVLESYAEEMPNQPGHWRLLAQEAPAVRREDLAEVRGMLRETGARMGFDVSGETPLTWTPQAFGQVYFFYPMASSLVSRYILGNPPAPVRQCVMVFPGSRARLLSFKLRRDPRLADLLKGWHLLRFRLLRSLYARK
nr:hypothetical protein [Anaerolinea sp.]